MTSILLGVLPTNILNKSDFPTSVPTKHKGQRFSNVEPVTKRALIFSVLREVVTTRYELLVNEFEDNEASSTSTSNKNTGGKNKVWHGEFYELIELCQYRKSIKFIS
nr:7001_t:CDS:2 [Entrophospora candida]